MGTDDLFNDACPCGHEWEVHTHEDGCLDSWEWDGEGLATREGCKCQLAHTEKSVR